MACTVAPNNRIGIGCGFFIVTRPFSLRIFNWSAGEIVNWHVSKSKSSREIKKKTKLVGMDENARLTRLEVLVFLLFVVRTSPFDIRKYYISALCLSLIRISTYIVCRTNDAQPHSFSPFFQFFFANTSPYTHTSDTSLAHRVRRYDWRKEIKYADNGRVEYINAHKHSCRI